MRKNLRNNLSALCLMLPLGMTSFGQISIDSPSVNATIVCTSTPVFTAPAASSTCSGVAVNLLAETTSGNSYQTVVTRFWDATDNCGNTSNTVSETITIIDTHSPTIGLAGSNATIVCTASPVRLHQMIW